MSATTLAQRRSAGARSVADLFSGSLAAATFERYQKHVGDFLRYYLPDATSLDDLYTLPNKMLPKLNMIDAMDMLLREYISDLYICHRSFTSAKLTFYGIVYFVPRCASFLYESQRYITSWQRTNPSVQHPPLIGPLVALMAVHMARTGYFDCGVLTLLAFDCYLRIGEFTSLRHKDIVQSPSYLNQLGFASMAVMLSTTKTGDNQSVIVRSTRIANLVRELIHRRANTVDRILSVGGSSFYRRVFTHTCRDLGLSNFHFTPHSLRHGGATEDHLRFNIPLPYIMQRGLWVSEASVRHYLQAGQHIDIASRLPPSIVNLLPSMMEHFDAIMLASWLPGRTARTPIAPHYGVRRAVGPVRIREPLG